MDANVLFESESYNIIGAAIAVHNELGFGFLEAVYQEALEIEFSIRNIPFRREVQLPIYYKGELLSKNYIVDFICYDKIIIELKALTSISPDHKSQVLNYLKASNKELGLLINFGESKLKHERLIRSLR
jgi:GxxExxY protein